MKAIAILKRVQYVTVGVEYKTTEEKNDMENILYNIAEDVDDWETDNTSVDDIRYEDQQDVRMLPYFNNDYKYDTRGRQFIASEYLDTEFVLADNNENMEE